MYQKADADVKVFPLPEASLRGAAVLACSIIDQEECVSECRKERESLQVAVNEAWRLVHELHDLFIRMDTALQLAVSVKQQPPIRPPAPPARSWTRGDR